MQFYAIEDVLVQPYLMEAFNPELIQDYISQLNTENLLIQVSSKSLESSCDLTEPIYGTKYSQEKISSEILAAFTNPDLSFKKSNKTIGLPPKNVFIPKSMQVLVDKNNASEVAALPKLP